MKKRMDMRRIRNILLLFLLAVSLPLTGTAARYVLASDNISFKVKTNEQRWGFVYVGQQMQTIVIPQDGYYALQLWGGDGGHGMTRQGGWAQGGDGAYVETYRWLRKGDVVSVAVGGVGEEGGQRGGNQTKYGGWNGGGDGKSFSIDIAGPDNHAGAGGGGGTDIRLGGTGLNNRIAVAGGGGGASGGYDYDGWTIKNYTRPGAGGMAYGSENAAWTATQHGDGFYIRGGDAENIAGTPGARGVAGGHGFGGSDLGGPGNGHQDGQYPGQPGHPGTKGQGGSAASDTGGIGKNASDGGGGGGGYYGGGGGGGTGYSTGTTVPGGGGGGSSFVQYANRITAGWAKALLSVRTERTYEARNGMYQRRAGYCVITYLGGNNPGA